MKISRENDVTILVYCLAQSKYLTDVSCGQWAVMAGRAVMGVMVVVLTTVVGMVVTVVMKFWASDWILVMQKTIKGRKDKHTLGSYHTSCDKDSCKGTWN